MALVDRYVSSAASGGGTGTINSPWTLTESLLGVQPGTRVLWKADGTYPLSAAVTQTNAGTAEAPIIFEGYKNVPGDGYLGRTNGGYGPLITSNMPVIAMTAGGRIIWAAGTFVSCLNVSRTASTTANTVFGGTLRNEVTRCVLSDASTAAAVGILQTFQHVSNCDLFSAGAGGFCVNMPTGSQLRDCRLSSPSNHAVLLANAQFNQTISGCQFFNSSVAIRVTGTSVNTGKDILIENNTAYAVTQSFLELPNNATVAAQAMIRLVNNHVTDGGKLTDSLYTAGFISGVLRNNRTRDLTGVTTCFGDWPNLNEITADTGGWQTDYVDAPGGDFRLITGAPGRGSGFPANRDIGAIQHTDGVGGASTSSIFGSSIIRAGGRTH